MILNERRNLFNTYDIGALPFFKSYGNRRIFTHIWDRNS